MSCPTGPQRNAMVALAFYGGLSGIALLWGLWTGRPNLLWESGVTARSLLLGLLAGVALALLVVGISRALLRLDWARSLTDWFYQMLGPLRWRDAAALAAFSAIGEELLFRGAMQHHLGLWPAAAIFAAAHIPPRRELWPWTVSAGLIGLALGLCASWSGNLLGPIAAHFLINLLNLRQACGPRGRRDLPAAPQAGPDS